MSPSDWTAMQTQQTAQLVVIHTDRTRARDTDLRNQHHAVGPLLLITPLCTTMSGFDAPPVEFSINN